MPMNVGVSWAKLRKFQYETVSSMLPAHISARHAGLLVVDQPEAAVALVLRGVVGRPLTALIRIRDHAQHEGLGVADNGPQGG